MKYLLTGVLFGIVLVKGEIISWFRIQEMFRFQSFHMYGIIGSAVVVGMISVALLKRFKGITIPPKKFHKGQVYGGFIFGLGWAMTGACPGPIFAQIGSGQSVVIVVLMSAIAGTWTYGYLKGRINL